VIGVGMGSSRGQVQISNLSQTTLFATPSIILLYSENKATRAMHEHQV